MAKHKQIALQWIPGHCQIAGDEHADALAKKGCQNYTNTYKRNILSITLHLKQVFQSVYRHELETMLSQKPWKQELTKIPDWPRRKAVAEFRLGMIVWVHTFTELESALNPTACYVASANPRTETI